MKASTISLMSSLASSTVRPLVEPHMCRIQSATSGRIRWAMASFTMERATSSGRLPAHTCGTRDRVRGGGMRERKVTKGGSEAHIRKG
eukprot:5675062-Pyramimonas_sp.AAC.2